MRKTDVAMRRKPRKRPRNRRNIRRETRVQPFFGHGSPPKPGKLDARNVLLKSQMDDRALSRSFNTAEVFRSVHQIHDEHTIDAEVPDQPVLIEVLNAMNMDTLSAISDEELQNLRDWFASEEGIRGPNYENVEAQIAERLGVAIAEEMDEMIVNGYVANEETLNRIRDGNVNEDGGFMVPPRDGAVLTGRVRSQSPNMQELPSDSVEIRGRHFRYVPAYLQCCKCGEPFKTTIHLVRTRRYDESFHSYGFTQSTIIEEYYDGYTANTCPDCKRLHEEKQKQDGMQKRRVLKL